MFSALKRLVSPEPKTQNQPPDHSSKVIPKIYEEYDELVLTIRAIQRMKFEEVMHSESAASHEFTRLKADVNNIVKRIYFLIKKYSFLHTAKVDFSLAEKLRSQVDAFISDICSMYEFRESAKSKSKPEEAIAGFIALQKENFGEFMPLFHLIEDEVENTIAKFANSISICPMMTKKQLIELLRDYDDNECDQQDFLRCVFRDFMETEEFLECKDDIYFTSKRFLETMSLEAKAALFAYYDQNRQLTEWEQPVLCQLLFQATTVAEIARRREQSSKDYNAEKFEKARVAEETWLKIMGYLPPSDYSSVLESCTFFGRIIASENFYPMRASLGKDYLQRPPRVVRHKFASNDMMVLDGKTTAAVHKEGVSILRFTHSPGERYDVESEQCFPFPGSKIARISECLLAIVGMDKIYIFNWQTGELQSEIRIIVDEKLISLAATETHVIMQTISGQAYFWNIATQNCQLRLPRTIMHDEEVLVSKDGKIILLARDNAFFTKIRIYDNNLKLLKEFDSGISYCLLPGNELAVMKFEEDKQETVIDIFDLNELDVAPKSYCFPGVKMRPSRMIALSNEVILTSTESGIRGNDSVEFKVWDMLAGEVVRTWNVKDGGGYAPKLMSLENGNVLAHFPYNGSATFVFPTIKRVNRAQNSAEKFEPLENDVSSSSSGPSPGRPSTGF